ncbi:MAG: MBL fold metallo-hydrolase [Lachnospiraceae bacterium]|nr:MBL fold metallo-hydrolase [Lachnospiraceae bacterium]
MKESEKEMRIVNLIENVKGNPECDFEHGLSLYVETKKHKLLVDTGCTDKFLENAKKLSVQIGNVDSVILSHGHYDHGGGILDFAKVNSKAKIYVRDNVFSNFYHGWDENKRYIGLDKRIADLSQLYYVSENMKMDEELFLFTNVSSKILWPKGNLELTVEKDGSLVQDDFSHEQYLVISQGEKSILISGCAHNGILNILEEYRHIFSKEPDVVISGLHMMKKSGYQPEDIELIEQTAWKLKEYKTKFYTCHCTGEEPYERMKRILKDQIEYVKSGEEIKIEV